MIQSRVLGALMASAFGALTVFSPGAMAVVVSDQLEALYENGSFRGWALDYWSFSTNGGALTADIFANGYGGTAFDSQIWLFSDDGTLDASDFMIQNDDEFSNGFSDGSTSVVDSYLDLPSAFLTPGSYLLAIGACCTSAADIVDGFQSNTTTPPVYDSAVPYYYQLTFTGDVSDLSLVGASAVPVPAAVWLFGSGLLGLIGVARRTNNH